MISLTESILSTSGVGIKARQEKITNLLLDVFALDENEFTFNENEMKIIINKNIIIHFNGTDIFCADTETVLNGYSIRVNEFIDLLKCCDDLGYTIEFYGIFLRKIYFFSTQKELSRLFFKILKFDIIYVSIFYASFMKTIETDQFLSICKNKKICILVDQKYMKLGPNDNTNKYNNCSAKQSIQNMLSVKANLIKINFNWDDKELKQRYIENSIARIGNWIGDITNVGCKELKIIKSKKVTDYERRSKKMLQTEEEQIKLFKQNNKNCKLTIQNY